MNNKAGLFVTLLGVFIAVGIYMLVLKPPGIAKSAIVIGQPAPEIVGTDIDGQPMKLSDFRGKAVLLDFWGHW